MKKTKKQHGIVLKAPIVRLLPEGDVFGTKTDDEFKLHTDNGTEGIFKRFEYLSLPFSITGNRDLYEKLLKQAELKNISFNELLKQNSSAQAIVDMIFQKMEENPAFSKQTLDMLLGKVYVMDAINTQNIEGECFEDYVAYTIENWKRMSDFFCIEGLVGGNGKNNPFLKGNDHNFIAGGLDSLETFLPSIKEHVDNKTWTKIILQLSSILCRDYKQIDQAVEVLDKIVGKKDLDVESIDNSIKLLDELVSTNITSNIGLAKFYNSIIRFNNWIPQQIKSTDNLKETYDSVCIPAKKALELVPDEDINTKLNSIKDATSPKGLALATLVDQELLGNKKLVENKLRIIQNNETSKNSLEKYAVLSFDDAVFYTGLTGGKWKGLKLLSDLKKAFGLSYEIPKAKVLTSLAINSLFEKSRISELIYENLFVMGEEIINKITNKIDSFSFERFKKELELTTKELVVRSSMYGEDGQSNFSGTYESVHTIPELFNEACKIVTKSYFSSEAVHSREDLGLAHLPGISIIVQEKVDGLGGVIHLTKDSYRISFAKTAEDAVLGNGTHITANSIEELLKGSLLSDYSSDLFTIHETFGDSDIEFVVNKDALYLIQLRPKYSIKKDSMKLTEVERVKINNLKDLNYLKLEKKCVVSMDFLGKENINNEESKIMDFIRRNIQYITAIEGRMPSVAHIPNKIEGHFRIPYVYRSEEKYCKKE